MPEFKPAPRIDDKDLHDDSPSYGVVYANEPASKAYAEGASRPFPVGSVLVRERLPQLDSTTPELLAVMIKREKGFNPAGGDWLFMTVDGEATKITKRQKKGSCLNCHQSARDRDFVFELK